MEHFTGAYASLIWLPFPQPWRKAQYRNWSSERQEWLPKITKDSKQGLLLIPSLSCIFHSTILPSKATFRGHRCSMIHGFWETLGMVGKFNQATNNSYLLCAWHGGRGTTEEKIPPPCTPAACNLVQSTSFVNKYITQTVFNPELNSIYC